MNKINDLMDIFCNLNDALEVCRGYAQCDEPDMKALESVLYALQMKYREIYAGMRSCLKGEMATNE